MSHEAGTDGGFKPHILVFSTHNISDPGIDLAGSRHMHYPATASTIAVPCSSGLKPSWIVHALESGIDGVFIASDGEECAYLPDCSERTAKIAAQAQDLLRERGVEASRLKMAAVCSVCAESFVKYMTEFSASLAELGPVKIPVA
jgi:F420-non-reducing hydrogenase iron-sulfur subunit